MNADVSAPIEQLRNVLEELESLAKAASGAVDEGQSETVERLYTALSAARSRIKDAEHALERNVAQGAKAADDFVHENTWISIGIAAAVAFLLGALTAKRE